MKFLLDAQLPARLGRQLSRAGHDSLHTTDLPLGNRTSDADVARIADEQDRVLVTKDSDFRDSHLLRASPRRLLILSTGNISNKDLLALFDQHLETVIDALGEASFVEFGPDRLTLHED